jgi:hypothetical protein
MASLPRNHSRFRSLVHRKLQPSSTLAYISALKFVHTLRGLPVDDLLSDPILQTVLRAAAHQWAISDPPSTTK